MNYLSVQDLGKSYGVQTLFKSLNFGIDQGQKVALVARNGTGKTTSAAKLAKLYRGKIDQNYPLFVLYNKSNVPKRLSDKKFYKKVYKSLLEGCIFLQKNNCRFILFNFFHWNFQNMSTVWTYWQKGAVSFLTFFTQCWYDNIHYLIKFFQYSH